MAYTNEPTLIKYNDGFDAVIGSNYSYYTVAETDAHEGPVYFHDTNELYFTSNRMDSNTPNVNSYKVAIRKIELSNNNKVVTVAEPSNMANGMTMDMDNQLVICEQGSMTQRARISQYNRQTGEFSNIVDSWFGLTFNSPNDVVVKRDGTVWFTDPAYGHAQGFKPEPLVGNFVYRFDPSTGETTVVADNFIRPNGLAFSADQTQLYINDSGALLGDSDEYHVDLPHHIKVYDILDDRNLANERLFAVVTPGIPDGLKVDTEDRVYSSCATGVKVYSQEGVLLGEILAEGVANFTFGGPKNNILYMCTNTAVVATQLAAVGANQYL